MVTPSARAPGYHPGHQPPEGAGGHGVPRVTERDRRSNLDLPGGVVELPAVDGQRVDDEDVDGDDEQAPDGVGPDEGQVHQCAESGEDDADGAGGEVAGQDASAAGHQQQADEQVDGAPDVVVDVDDEAVLAHDVEAVVEERHQSLDGLEGAHQEHHEAGEHDPAGP